MIFVKVFSSASCPFIFPRREYPILNIPCSCTTINAAEEKIKTHTLISYKRQPFHAKEGAAHLCHTSVAALGLVITESTDEEYTLVPNFRSHGIKIADMQQKESFSVTQKNSFQSKCFKAHITLKQKHNFNVFASKRFTFPACKIIIPK